MKNYLSLLLASITLLFASCNDDDDNTTTPPNGELIQLENRSDSPILLKKMSGFEGVEIYNLLSSEDTYIPNFTYGSMADGAGLLRNDDGTYTLINNIEADYAIARITLDETFKPIKGEHILNATATAQTAQCSGSLITPEEHGFGPLYLSGGEWGGNSKGVFATDPFRNVSIAGTPRMLTAMGQWSTENAVAIGKDAYPGKTVVFIGDDDSDNETPSGQLGMYVGNTGDVDGGKLYGLKVTSPGVTYEMDMEEGVAYDMEFVELTEKDIDLLDAEAKTKGVLGFSRLEDIDWRRGSASNNREVYLAVTGRDKPGLIGKGTRSGRVYKVVLNENDPTGAGKITCVLDGDKVGGKAEAFHSPDNILVTQNYAYIQEDPNGIEGFKPAADHYARLYQYDLNSGVLKAVLECDQVKAAAEGYGNTDKKWEITGMIDISDIIGVNETFLMVTQNHGWEKADGTPFTDPKANADLANSRKEGSMLYVIKGLAR
ncbi:alkaline phosphatase PhoX [Aquimarina sp. 2201CG5-10]|uniref:alkaline phosphatase PhoX n=1 Tax=Aquimarina callyspongiae TaxID=3098150 RepID=UPI002AB36D7C|nr:alkaline phosphatase PhoX [Aquimarina sp. 2201CG5-10]MDY8135595.1 phosphatase [Aquimarina sp. 2201CG5-10]